MTVAVILAGGSGQRASGEHRISAASKLGGEMPKQFLKMSGKLVIEYSLDAFESNALIDEICVVCNSGYIALMQEIKKKGKWSKLRRIIPGGKERYLSSLAAIREYQDVDFAGGRMMPSNGIMKDNHIIFHDAARPLVSQRIITQVAEALKKRRAVTVAVKACDTVISVSPHSDLWQENRESKGEELLAICNVLDRSCLYNAQTPQAFHLNVIEKAYSIALQDKDFKATDDCGVVCKYLPDEPIFAVRGERANIKITYEEDFAICEALLKLHKL